MGQLEAFSSKGSKEARKSGREFEHKDMSEIVSGGLENKHEKDKPKEEWRPIFYKDIPDYIISNVFNMMRGERLHSLYYRDGNDIYKLEIGGTGLLVSKVGDEKRDVPAGLAYTILRQATFWLGDDSHSSPYGGENISSELPIVYTEIKEKTASLEEKYGFKIKFENSRGKEAELEAVNKALDFLTEALRAYPYETAKSAGIQNVYLLAELRTLEGAKVNGLQENKDIYIDVKECVSNKCNAHATLHHELFHLFDKNDSDEDNDKWKKQNPRGKKHYVHESSSKAILSGDLENGGKCVTDKEGFQRSYGYCGGVEEDQATVAEEIFAFKYKTDSAKKAYLERLVSDKWLRSKIEMVTGCGFNVEERKFGKLITEEEYKTRFKTSGYEYYAKWSKNDKGEPTMGLDFWNKILEVA